MLRERERSKEPLFGEIPRRGREDRAVEEKKVFVQAAVRVAALIGVILFIEFGTDSKKFIWYAALCLIPLEVFIILTSIKVYASLKTALQKWLVVPFMKWIDNGA